MALAGALCVALNSVVRFTIKEPCALVFQLLDATYSASHEALASSCFLRKRYLRRGIGIEVQWVPSLEIQINCGLIGTRMRLRTGKSFQ